jgi:hypothetical protein
MKSVYNFVFIRFYLVKARQGDIFRFRLLGGVAKPSYISPLTPFFKAAASSNTVFSPIP